MRLAQTDDTAFPLTFTLSGASGGVTGLAPVVAVRKGSDYLDFSDLTFKASGWTTRQQALAEVDATDSPGSYEFSLDVSAIASITFGELWSAEYQLAGSVDISENIATVTNIYNIVSGGGDNSEVIDAINQQTLVLLEACTPTQNALVKGQRVPNVYTGHKGDTLLLPVFRNNSVMPDAELTGATNLSIQFKNLDGSEEFSITVGVGIGPAGTGTIEYTTVDGDGVFESGGRWEYQATGDATSGADFRSQKETTQALDPVPTPP